MGRNRGGGEGEGKRGIKSNSGKARAKSFLLLYSFSRFSLGPAQRAYRRNKRAEYNSINDILKMGKIVKESAEKKKLRTVPSR